MLSTRNRIQLWALEKKVSMKEHIRQEERKHVVTPWGYATLTEKTENSAKVQFSWGGTGYVDPGLLSESISIQVKTFTKLRKCLDFDWKLCQDFSKLFSKVSYQLELPSHAVLKLYYPMGTLKEVKTEDSPLALQLPSQAKLIAIVKQNFLWDQSKKGSNIEIYEGGTVALKKTDDEFESVLGNVCLSCGKYYWEVKIDLYVDDEDIHIGVAKADLNLYTRPPESDGFWGYTCSDGNKFGPGSGVEEYAEPARTGDVIGISLHYEGSSGMLTFLKNGKNFGVAFNNVPMNVHPAVSLFYCRAQVRLEYKL
mmetsp:Transcript_8474/g.12519  ORF Transcript_8474/g.12519 Transcript_8474/m.12519 type:complete len:310 (-) Transcript_8474:33-962(-)